VASASTASVTGYAGVCSDRVGKISRVHGKDKRNILYVKKYFDIPACDFQLDLPDTEYGYNVASLTHISCKFT